jgi:hypothetical protein
VVWLWLWCEVMCCQSVSKRSVKIGSGKCRFEAGVRVTNVESPDSFIQKLQSPSFVVVLST